MSVETILSKKGREVLTIRPDQSMAEAVDLLNRHRIGASVVTGGDGSVVGILSERDVLRAVAERGGSALGDAVKDCMTEKVVTCAPSTTIDEVMGVMTNGKFRHLPVVEGGRLAGIISIGDVVKHRLAEAEAEHRALRDYIATA